jgi:mannonate dehydratase
MGTDVMESIRYFAGKKKVWYVHFRDVRGGPDDFDECFIDEGQTDMFEAMKAFHEAGFDGVLMTDHTPVMVGDTGWGHRGRAYAMGYMKALKKMVESLSQ